MNYTDDEFKLAMIALRFSEKEIPENEHFEKAYFTLFSARSYLRSEKARVREKRISAEQLQERLEWKKKDYFQQKWVEACADKAFGNKNRAHLYSMAAIGNNGKPAKRGDTWWIMYQHKGIPESIAQQFETWVKSKKSTRKKRTSTKK